MLCFVLKFLGKAEANVINYFSFNHPKALIGFLCGIQTNKSLKVQQDSSIRLTVTIQLLESSEDQPCQVIEFML